KTIIVNRQAVRSLYADFLRLARKWPILYGRESRSLAVRIQERVREAFKANASETNGEVIVQLYKKGVAELNALQALRDNTLKLKVWKLLFFFFFLNSIPLKKK